MDEAQGHHIFNDETQGHHIFKDEREEHIFKPEPPPSPEPFSPEPPFIPEAFLSPECLLSTEPTKPKRKDLTLQEKVMILENYDQLPKMSQRNAALVLKISQPLLCKILKNRLDIESEAMQNENPSRKRKRAGKDGEVELALKLWFAEKGDSDEIDGPTLRRKAEELAAKMGKVGFVATDGWLTRWKRRSNVVFKQDQREDDGDYFSSWIDIELPKIIDEYSPENVYTAVETGLYYRALPEHRFLFAGDNEKEEYKSLKEYVTVLCCVNMSGWKEKLVVIGESKNRKYLKDAKKLPVDYYSNKNGWMTTEIFNEWLLKWDRELERNVVLLVDSCTPHSVRVPLTHIQMIFLPNTTSVIQDQRIIRSFKTSYRLEMRTRLSEEECEDMKMHELSLKTNLLDALHLMAMSWTNTDEPMNFNHGVFAKEQIEMPRDLSEEVFEEWMTIDENATVVAKMTDSDICQFVTQKDDSNQYDEGEDSASTSAKVPTSSDMREALRILRLGVQHRSEEFQPQYEYEAFVNKLLRNADN